MSILFGPANFTFVRGTGWNEDVALTDKATGSPVNLAGITRILMRVRQDIAGPIVAELSTTTGELQVIDAATGLIGIRCDTDFTLTFPDNDNVKAKYVYDAVIERAAGEYEPGIGGKITVLPQITRPWGTT